MTHVEDLVHLLPRGATLLLDEGEEGRNGEHVVLDDVLPLDEVEHLCLGSTRAVYHPMDLGAKLLEHLTYYWSIGTSRREDELSCI